MRFVAFVVALLGVATSLTAAEPVVSVGKPRLRDIAYSPDGRYLATLTAEYLELLDAETHAPGSRVSSQNANALLYSPDGRLLALIGATGGIQLLDADDLSTKVALPESGGRGRAAFSPDGRLLAVAKGDTVLLWDTTTRTVLAELSGDDGPQLVRELTDDGRVVDRHHTQYVTSLAFHPDGRTVAVGSIRSTVALWDVETASIVDRLDVTRTGYARSLRFSDDGRFLLGATSGAGIALWQVGSPAPRFIQAPGTDWRDGTSLAFSPDGRHALVGDEQSRLRIVDTVTLEQRLVLAPDFGPEPPRVQSGLNRLVALTRSPDETRLAGVIASDSIVVWGAQDYAVQARIYGYHQTHANALYLPAVGRIVTGVHSLVMTVWDATTGAIVGAAQLGGSIDRLAAHPDGRRVAVDAYGGVEVWDIASMERPSRLDSWAYGTELAFSPSGSLLLRHGYGGTHVWHVTTGEEASLTPTRSDGPPAVFTHDERQIVAPTTEEEPRIAYWDIATGERRRVMRGAGPVARVGRSMMMAREAGDALTFVRLPLGQEVWRAPKPSVFAAGRLDARWLRFSDTGRLVAINQRGEGGRAPVNFAFYLAQVVGAIPGHEDFRLVDDDRHMFLRNDDGSLGLYRTGDMLRPLAVDVEGSALTNWASVKRTRLLPNFPNPFNPETWIPFELADDARVVVGIYDLRGGLVREIDLGERHAGRHASRATAAYWDGRDARGEPVASGVYVYEMTSAERTDRRRMSLAK